MAKKALKIKIGIDEVGRGPLAGPVVACAACSRRLYFPGRFLKEVKDSKKMSPKKREEIFKVLKKCPRVEWGIGRVSEKVIDRINILEATKLAMKRAVNNLEKKLPLDKGCGNGLTVEKFLLIDGNFGINLNVHQKSIIKGDEKIFLIKVASIAAKVTRDRLMAKYHKKYPQYGFDKHKGYGTLLHLEMLRNYGPCSLHRKSFRPVKEML